MVTMGDLVKPHEMTLDQGGLLHRCPFPIGWLMKKEGLGETPLTAGFYDDRWYTSHRPKPIFTKRTDQWSVDHCFCFQRGVGAP